MRKISLVLIFIFINFTCLSNANEKILIKFKINEDLITNYDIIKESKYLMALNKDLVGMDENLLLKFAQDSLIKEKVKKYEIEKYYKINYESESANIFIKNFMKNLKIKNETDFENYLSTYETSIKEIKRKLLVEQAWNNMILDIYENRVSINEKKISKTLEELIKNKKNQKSFELYELVFLEKSKKDLQEKYEEIILSIKNIGFKKTALIHSISSTAKQNGKIGWVNQNQLTQKISVELKNLDIGSYTKPINSAGGTIILYINNIKEVSIQDINKELELSKIISAEKNRQLNEFSVIHYKKTENKSYVKKF